MEDIDQQIDFDDQDDDDRIDRVSFQNYYDAFEIDDDDMQMTE